FHAPLSRCKNGHVALLQERCELEFLNDRIFANILAVIERRQIRSLGKSYMKTLQYLHTWFENVWMALDTLRTHKLRSFLTVLGVIIGTMTVIVIAAFVSG